jgi:integrase
MLKHLDKFCPNDISFKDVDKTFVENFRNYLDKDAIGRAGKKLSQNSKHSYFGKFMAALKQAVKDDILKVNPDQNVKHFKQGEPQREFLTLDELQAAVNTECEIPILKTAFIFSTLTGLRWSDIEKLKWSEIQHSKEMGYYIRFTQKKTKGVETLPISEQARKLLGEEDSQDTLIFKGLHYSAWSNLKLQQWMMKAGITKTITFHCARHTYATLQLTLGTDIYTVSKLLGHKELRTTQIYAKVIDDKKREAANKINLDL